MNVGAPFLPTDVEAFARFGIDLDLLTAAGVRRVTHQQAIDDYGIRYRSDHLEGVAFPYANPCSGEPVTCRIRRDHPEIDADGRPIAKYVQPPDRHHLFFPPAASALVADVDVPAVFVEAEKSSLTLTAAAARLGRRRLVIATGGCWGWKGTIGKATDADGARVDERGPLADFDRVVWTGRDAVILFDANATTNADVQKARRALARELASRGARVRVVDLPTEPDVNGPDDYRAAHDDAALFALLDAAKAFTPRAAKTDPEKPRQGHTVQLEDPEPWPTAVDGARLIEGLETFIRTYLVLRAHQATALALWVLHAFAIDDSYISPILAVTSPTMRCGKTAVLIILGALAPRRLSAANITAAGLFRTIEKFCPSLFIDEADSFLRESEELRGVLNSGHTRKTATVIRLVGDDYEPREFSTWCPKVIALIGRLPTTLADRSIEIEMRRRTASERIKRLRQDTIDLEGGTLRRQAARWAADHHAALQAADPHVPDSLNDRASDCWRPLLAIADAAGGEWPDLARKAAQALSGNGNEDEADADIGIELLKDMRDIFDDVPPPVVDGAIKTDVLLKRLHDMTDRPWAAFGRTEKPLSSHRLARLLKPFGIIAAGRLQFDNERHRGYRTDAFDDAFSRYLPSKASKCPDPNKTGPEVANSKCPDSSTVDTLKTAVSPMNTGLPDTWTLRNPDRAKSDVRASEDVEEFDL